MAIYYAYMIKSENINKNYYGHTSELKERLHEHNSNQSPFTRGKGPWKLVGYIQCVSKSESIRIEEKLKKMKNPSRAMDWIDRNGKLV